jgi:hypothetical protein
MNPITSVISCLFNPRGYVQTKRVQKCVETLDMLKVSNARLQAVIVTTKWETFEAPATTQWELFD